MVLIKPFKAVRPIPERAAQVAALPYDVMSSQEAWKIAEDNPYSFLRIDKAEITLEPGIDLYDPRVYQQAAANLKKLREEGVLIQDERPFFYIYQLIMEGRQQTGLVVTASIDDYLNNRIKKHEFTREDKEVDRFNHVDHCNANTGPIFMTYPFQENITKILAQWMREKEPVCDFQAKDGVEHKVWVIDQKNVLEELVRGFAAIEAIYIADGHHRSASAVKVGLKRREANPEYNGGEAFNYFLAVLFADQELMIMDYNRIVKDLKGLSPEQFLEKVKAKFQVEEQGPEPFRPMAPRTFGMYLKNKWYKLTPLTGTFPEQDPVSSLDVSILQDNLLNPILGIADPRTDERIDFIGGIRGLEELAERVEKGEGEVAFSLYPTTVQELMTVADRGQVMPPKSTWFEPKLRSGLFIHTLDD